MSRMITGFCGVDVNGEEGYCARHLAALIDVPKHRIDYLRHSRQVEAFPARTLTCGAKRRGDCLIPLGEVLTSDVLRPA